MGQINLALEQYYCLVHMYSVRELTKESDRLPAFSGPAQRIHRCLEGEYLAGLWSCDFNRSLDWQSYRVDWIESSAYERRDLRFPIRSFLHES
ncbi:uncharacterized protein F4807DRAFT_413613 [Annulohypoxylon truncatum]|uniref:uncharacterized protein n=1 Tax=Annulohypoxylon truncatum TaxID=327061 RepID=UPI0020084DFE|nr:uncharacterized protein F4807DRAFT_413613 [Annulohypoxylon truncatum]KAI1212586.1 hypothetical protein F4807DRAFT_413613 [Annulohypoxylon truncatum]